MLFHVLSTYRNVERVVLNDLNGDLVSAYKAVRDDPCGLLDVLGGFQVEYGRIGSEEGKKAYYLAKRDEYNGMAERGTLKAALFVFLNKTCFNGLYRVNSRGEFNVPFGKAAKPLICDRETVMADSWLLRNVEILNGDFEGVLGHVVEGERAFFYFDPPYRPIPGSPSFTAYQKEGFGDERQARLAGFCRKLDALGHRWLLSNSDPANSDPGDRFFDELFSGFDIRRVDARRSVNSNGSGRGKITELAIRNYVE